MASVYNSHDDHNSIKIPMENKNAVDSERKQSISRSNRDLQNTTMSNGEQLLQNNDFNDIQRNQEPETEYGDFFERQETLMQPDIDRRPDTPDNVNQLIPKAPIVPSFNTPRTITINGVSTVIPDVDVYQQRKTLAQGMMDLALLSANANQLRYVLESYNRHPYFYPSIIFISLSLFFQIAVGIGLIWNSRYNVNDEKERCYANRINNFTVIGIFVVTVVNVFVSSFGVAEAPRESNG